ncbi:MAG: D-alanine--D-alanine ligase [Ruminococcus sp.]|nr:D-alanine--D-alanine ligase [Ruminococcus sp.]
MAKIKAAVIFGGTAQEHELSLASAAEVIRNIPTDKYDVTCIGITKKGRWLYFPGDVEEIADGSWEMNPDNASAILSPDPLHRGIVVIEDGDVTVRRIDVAFPVLHGKKGADGTIQALLDMSCIPYVGSGHLAAASCMDKSHTHMMLDDYGIATADWKLITQRDINCIDKRCEEIAAALGFPVVIKPANSGCSAGTTIAHDIDELNTAVKVAFSNDNKGLAEKYCEARKLEVAVFGYDSPIASNVGEILSLGKKYNPTEVRKNSGDDFIIPADLPDELAKNIRSTAIKTFKALGCRSLARVDFLLTEDGKLLLNKTVTSPGLRQNSVFPKLMAQFGIDMPELTDMLLEQALENSERAY